MTLSWTARHQAAQAFDDAGLPFLQGLVFRGQPLFPDLVNLGVAIPPVRDVFARIAGEDDVPDVDPLVADPPIDVANGFAEATTVDLPLGSYILDIGSPFEVGEQGGFSRLGNFLDLPITEFSGIVRDTIDADADADDNDAEQILAEILTGASGANFDFETDPGIDGVELVGLTRESYMLALEDGDVEDLLTLAGPGTAAVLAGFVNRANISDSVNAISLVDVATESVIFGTGAANPIADLVGDSFEAEADLAAIFAAANDDGDDRVTLLSASEDSFSVRVENLATDAFDFLVFDNSDGERVIDYLM